MNFSVTSLLIDVMVVFVIISFTFYGYSKGFIVRLYDFLATLFAFLAALFISAPLSNIFTIYKVTGPSIIFGNLGNRLLVFVILFIIFKLILWIVGKFIRPLIKGVVSKIGLIKHFDRLLGMILSFVQAIILINIVLMLIISPLFKEGQQKIKETVIAKNILALVPVVNAEINLYTTNFNSFEELVDQGINYDALSSDSIYNVSVVLNNAYENDLISKEQLENYVINFYQDIDDVKGDIVLSQNQYEEVIKLFNNIDNDNLDEQKILSKMLVK